MVDILDRFYIKQNDLLPDLVFQFLDEVTGLPIPFPPGSTVEFHMLDINDPEGGLKVQGNAEWIDELIGKGKYVWQTGDTDLPGRYPAEIQATIPGARSLTGPNRRNLTIIITEELG